MKTFKTIFYWTTIISVVALVSIIVNNMYGSGVSSELLSRIFTGIFTGSILGAITALINYLGLRNQILDDLYDSMANIMVDLQGAQDLLNNIDTSELDITSIETTEKNSINILLNGSSQLISKALGESSKIDSRKYIPFCCNKILTHFQRLHVYSRSQLTKINTEMNECRMHHLQYLIIYPKPINSISDEKAYNNEKIDGNKLFIKSLHKLNDSVSMAIVNFNKEMREIDSKRYGKTKRWKEIENIFK